MPATPTRAAKPAKTARSTRALLLELDTLLGDKQFERVRAKVARALRTATPYARRHMVDRLFWAAAGLQRADAFEAAIRVWNLSLRVNPRQPRALQYRGRCYHHLGRYPHAIADFTRQLALTPGDRDALVVRAEARRAAGDAAGAREDQERADAIYDFDLPPEKVAAFRALRARDPNANLLERLDYFRTMDDALADQSFGFVPMVIASGWAVAFFAGDVVAPFDLAYTVGLYYRFGHPELHVVSKGVPAEEITERLNAIARRIADGHKVGRAAEEGLRFREPSRVVLASYPFGLGEYFYRHFADTSLVPLKSAALLPRRRAAKR